MTLMIEESGEKRERRQGQEGGEYRRSAWRGETGAKVAA